MTLSQCNVSTHRCASHCDLLSLSESLLCLSTKFLDSSTRTAVHDLSSESNTSDFMQKFKNELMKDTQHEMHMQGIRSFLEDSINRRRQAAQRRNRRKQKGTA